MATPRTLAPDVGTCLHIHEASQLLSVPAPTLRSWELRYGLPITLRSPGGHRRYTPAALNELSLMRDEIAKGRQPSDAARRVRILLDAQNPARPRTDALMAASEEQDSSAIRAVLEESASALGLAATLDDVVLPSMRQIGLWWESGRCDIGREHFTTEVVRGWLAKTTTLAPLASSDPCVLLATGPRDAHTLGIEALAALLVTGGTGCRTLGARTPVHVLEAAVVAMSPSAAVIVSHLSTQRHSAIESLNVLAATGCPTYYAGNAFISALARRRVPGTYLGERMVDAAAMIQRALPTEPPLLVDARTA
jgi:DNA-binding transcriptional MerR regulator